MNDDQRPEDPDLLPVSEEGEEVAAPRREKSAEFEVRDEIGDQEQLYAVHNSEGEQLALVADRKLAFTLARQHDFAPVAVH